MSIIEPLVKGAVEALNATGVKDDNIVIEDVSGSFELPLACSRCAAKVLRTDPAHACSG